MKKTNKSNLWNRLSYRDLPYLFEVRSQTFRNNCKISRSQPQSSTSIVIRPQQPQKRPFLTFQKQPQINAFVPKINGSYELQVEIALKPKVLSSEQCSEPSFLLQQKLFLFLNGNFQYHGNDNFCHLQRINIPEIKLHLFEWGNFFHLTGKFFP